MINKIAYSIALALLFISPSFASGDIKVKKVLKISDGDSFKIQTYNNRTIDIRLFGIDAPEIKQPYGTQSQDKLTKLLNSGTITYTLITKDSYGRVVADVYVDDTFVNLEMIKTGYAWYYEFYKRSDTFADAQKHAKNKKLGLWKDSNPTEPWAYRSSQRSKQGRNDPLIKSPVPDFYVCINLSTFDIKYGMVSCPKSYTIIIGD